MRVARVAVLLAAVAASFGAAVAATGLQPAVEPARGGSCVADPATMRREHMNLLRHQRDETVHAGVRQAPASLRGCVECHASKATGSVAAAKTDFCVSCHGYAAVQIDCFECHASRPGGAAKLAAQR